jgi:hypothetical protein
MEKQRRSITTKDQKNKNKKKKKWFWLGSKTIRDKQG